MLQLDVRLPLDSFELALDVEATASVTGIFGPSGCGKTSLLEVIAGLRPNATGRVRFAGATWLDTSESIFVKPERRAIGYVPQDGLLFPHMTVRKNLLAGARRAEATDGPSLAQVADLLAISHLLERDIPSLSGGERQRVALGRALCSGPRLLLLDEPFASLDRPLQRQLLPLLRRVREELTVPMLLVSHDPIEVQALCDDLLVLRNGVLTARGAPREVLTDPAVFPLAEQEGFENILPGRLVEPGRIRLGDPTAKSADGPELIALRDRDLPPGEVLIGIAADEVLVATEMPRGLSARNVLGAKIVDIRKHECFALVDAELAANVPRITIELAETTPAKLDVTVGSNVYLIVKAAAVRIYGGRVDNP